MKIKIDLSDPETRAIYESAEEAKTEVASWPAWKRGEPAERWAQDTAGTPWHRVIDTHRNALYLACGPMLVNAQGHSDGKPNTKNICTKCDGDTK